MVVEEIVAGGLLGWLVVFTWVVGAVAGRPSNNPLVMVLAAPKAGGAVVVTVDAIPNWVCVALTGAVVVAGVEKEKPVPNGAAVPVVKLPEAAGAEVIGIGAGSAAAGEGATVLGGANENPVPIVAGVENNDGFAAVVVVANPNAGGGLLFVATGVPVDNGATAPICEPKPLKAGVPKENPDGLFPPVASPAPILPKVKPPCAGVEVFGVIVPNENGEVVGFIFVLWLNKFKIWLKKLQFRSVYNLTNLIYDIYKLSLFQFIMILSNYLLY